MTTTAFDDQFTASPEPVRQPYDTVAILRRNIAALELALKQQTERALILVAISEDQNRLVRELDVLINGASGAAQQASLCDLVSQIRKQGLVIKQAPAVLEEWREALLLVSDDLAKHLDCCYPNRDTYRTSKRFYDAKMENVYLARALLQSTEVTK